MSDFTVNPVTYSVKLPSNIKYKYNRIDLANNVEGGNKKFERVITWRGLSLVCSALQTPHHQVSIKTYLETASR